MKFLDRIGNAIKEGQILFWVGPNLKTRVKGVDPGGLTNMANRSITPPKLVLEVTLEFPQADMSQPQLVITDMIVAADPVEQAKVDALIDAATGKPLQ